MERYEIIEIKNHLNNIGITGCDETSKGELAFSGASIPFDQIQVNSKFFYQDIPFKIFKTSQGDNIRLEAQKIKIKKSLLSVHFLGVSSRGDFQENIYFYNKNNKVKKDLSFTDFRTQKAFFDDLPAIKTSYIHLKSGKFLYSSAIVWYNYITFGSPFYCDYIQLPDNINMHIFAITICSE